MITIDGFISSKIVRHGFLTREGGVSRGLYASLNCGLGSDDDATKVEENRRCVLAEISMPTGALQTCYQIHSAKSVIVDKAWQNGSAPEADGMATNIPGIVLGILTADCAPVLFADERAGVIGAAHAGWGGAFGGVLEATLERMTELGARLENIKAAIGPCIAQKSYEVGPEFKERFVEIDTDNGRYFMPSSKAGHHMFDLTSYVENRLIVAGVSGVLKTNYDTYSDEGLFYSYRRSVHRDEKDYGREISVIALAP